MRLHYDGQWNGERRKYPVQMGTFFRPDDCPCTLKSQLKLSIIPCSCTRIFYDNLFAVTNRPIFKFGTWKMLPVEPEQTNCLLMSWSIHDEILIVALNMGRSECDVKTILLQEWKVSGVIYDILNSISNPSYVEFIDDVLVFRLPGYKTCIVSL
jgi:hypothetical protein